MKKYLIFLLCFLCLACSRTTTPSTSSQTIKVATSIYPLTYFTQQIGGQYVSVNPLVEIDANIHNYQLTIQQLDTAQSSNLILYIDQNLEPYLTEVIELAAQKNIPLVNIVSAIKKQTAPEIGQGQTLISGTLSVEESSKDGQAETNDILPNQNNRGADTITKTYNHLWLHPSYAIMMCDIIKAELIKLMPEQQAIFEANYDSLKSKLLNLNQVFQTLSDAPNKYFIVTHDAFSTWKSYGLNEIPILDLYENPLPEEEMQTFLDRILKLDLNYLYYEPNIDQAIIEQLKAELDLEPLILYNLSTLTKEQLENGEDYFSIMYENITTLKQELY